MNFSWTEIIGYIASALVALSFMLGNSIKRIRWVNMIGAMFFIAYGLIIESYPLLITNVLITIVQIYHLYTIYNTKDPEPQQ